jgi:hypothetical protein
MRIGSLDATFFALFKCAGNCHNHKKIHFMR